MSSISVDVVPSAVDKFTAIGTVGAAAVAVLALFITMWQARSTQKQLDRERKFRMADRIRQERVPQLVRIAELHSCLDARKPGEDHAGELASMQALLWIVPERTAMRVKHQYKVNLTPDEIRELTSARADGRLPEAYPNSEIYAELQGNIWAAGTDMM